MKTTIKQIADYWVNVQPIDESLLNFDWSDAHTHCWNCGDNKQSSSNKENIRLERAHIIPHALGGEDTASNYVLLCKECHREAPDSKNPKYIWEWIKSNRTTFGMAGTYKIDKALKIFEQRKGYSFFSEISKYAKSAEEVQQIFENEFKNINSHGYSFAIESYYVVLCETIDKICNTVK